MKVFTTREVHSLRHAPTWLLFTLSAGFVNAAAFLACDRFVSHMTGNATRIGTELARWSVASEFALVFVCFVMGASLSTLMIEGRHSRGRDAWQRAPLISVATILVLVALLGTHGWFGPFGATVDLDHDFLMLASLSLAMGMQNAAVASATANNVRTTHLTGPATNLGVGLAQLLYTRGEAFEDARRATLFRAAKVASFIVGGVLAIPICGRLSYLAFLFPAAATMVALASSFAPALPRRLVAMPARESVEVGPGPA